MIKLVCNECLCQTDSKSILTAPNPFDKNDEIMGCPKCKCVNNMRTACDEPGCWEEDTLGIPTEDGYRRVCYLHRII